MRFKICGLTDTFTAQKIVTMGADTLGFICVPESPRYVSPEKIAEIIANIPKNVSKVGVFVNSSIPEIVDLVEITGLTSVQLHGEETPQFCSDLREYLPHIEIIKAFRVQNAQFLSSIEEYYPVVDTLLLDAYQPNIYGGTGKQLNWQELTTFRPSVPWLLAGGINPDNVLNALNLVNCDGIDVSSGVESAPGKKDLDKVNQLFGALETIKNELCC